MAKMKQRNNVSKESLQNKLAKHRAQVCKALAPAVLTTMILISCVPQSGIIEPKPAITQAIASTESTPEEENTELGTDVVIASPTVENTLVPTATATKEATATPEKTATPEATATPKELTQTQIRAEILRAGVNLDDLASSTDEWTSSHISLDFIQNSIDHYNFGNEAENFVTTVVIGLEEAIKNPQELEQAIPTDGGWKIMAFVKIAFKDVVGNWQIAKIPVVAFHEENDLMWAKAATVQSGQYVKDADQLFPRDENNVAKLDKNGNFIRPAINYWIATNATYENHHGTGSFIKFFTGWVDDPAYANNDCMIGEPPRYTEEQLIEFRKTGDPHIFGYKDDKGYPIMWPLVTFQADISKESSYTIYKQP